MTDQNEYPRPESNTYSSDNSGSKLTPYQEAMQSSGGASQSTSAQGAYPQPRAASYPPASGSNQQAPAYGASMYPGGNPPAQGGPVGLGSQQFSTSTMQSPSPMAPVPFFKQETLASWLVNLLLASIIPFGIWLFVMAFSDMGSESKKQWARAMLVFAAIGIVLVILFWGVIGGLLYSSTY